MLGGNNSNNGFPIFLDEKTFPYPPNSTDQLQLFGNLPVGYAIGASNYLANEHNSPLLRPNKRGREADNLPRQQKLQISLNQNICHDETEKIASIPTQNPVSTGLKLSYDDDERNSSVTSASGCIPAASSVFLSLTDNIKTELDRQKEELEQYIKIQEENLVEGIRDMKQKQVTSLLAAIEKGVAKKLHEKDLELESINRRNRELVEKMKQVAVEAQNWCYQAKYNESVVNILKTNLQQAMNGADQGKEGFGDTDIDDASSVNPNNCLVSTGVNGKSTFVASNVLCRKCKHKEVSVLFMPCRHLCLCADCERSTGECPVCQVIPHARVQVFLS